MPLGKLRRALLSADQLRRHREDHRAVANAHIPFGALQAGGGWRYPVSLPCSRKRGQPPGVPSYTSRCAGSRGGWPWSMAARSAPVWAPEWILFGGSNGSANACRTRRQARTIPSIIHRRHAPPRANYRLSSKTPANDSVIFCQSGRLAQVSGRISREPS